MPFPKHTPIRLLLPLLSALLLTSCNWEKGLEETNYGSLSFEIVDASYESLVAAQGKPYHPDTIRVFDGAGKEQLLFKMPVDIPEGRRSWAFDLDLMEGGVPADTDFGKLDKTFYLYLDHRDVDTIRVIGRPDKVFVNGKELRGAPSGMTSQYAEYFYLKD